MYLAIRRRISYTQSVEARLVEQRANVAFLFLSYFDYVMLTYERYQALHVIHIRVPGEPGNEAKSKSLAYLFPSFLEQLVSWCGMQQRG